MLFIKIDYTVKISPFSYSDKIQVVAKQELIHIQIEFILGVKEMCDVTFPVAGMWSLNMQK